MGADLGRSDGALQDAGNLRERKFLEAGEQQHLAILMVELGEGRVEQRLVIARRGVLAGVRSVVHVVVKLRRVGGVRRGVGPAEMICGTSTCQMVHPRREAPVVAIGVAVLQHPLEDRLRHILGSRSIAGELQEKAKELAMMPLEKIAQRIELAVAHGQHQRMVGPVFGGSIHGGALNPGGYGWKDSVFERGNHSGWGTWRWLPRKPRHDGRVTGFVCPGEPGLGSLPVRTGLKLRLLHVQSGLTHPPMNRRDFLARSTMFTAAGALLARSAQAQPATPATKAAPATPAAAAAAPVTPEFKVLRRNVGVFTARGGSIGYLASPGGVVAVDTQFPDTAKLFLDGLPGRSGRSFDVVVNSHHHGDHVGGNGVLKPSAKMIVAHANVPNFQRERATRDNTLATQVYADTTFPQTWRKEVGDEVVSAKYHGAAHTNGDIVTLFERANVIHMGDLMFKNVYPVVDRTAGASFRSWIKVLEEVAKTYPTDAIYIFGHGSPKAGVTGKSSDLLAFRDYITALLEHVQKQIAAGEPKEKIAGLTALPGFPDYEMGTQRLPGNLSAAYDELTTKTG